MVDVFAGDVMTQGRAEHLHLRIVLRNCQGFREAAAEFC
jgi:hypothetical protein